MKTPPTSLMEARGVDVAYEPHAGTSIWAVRDVDLDLERAEFVGVVGESGCGKSTLGYALTRLLQPPARLVDGSIVFDGTDIAEIEGDALREQRRNGFALVLQSGMNALNPVRTIEQHLRDILRAHAREDEPVDRAAVHRRGVELLGQVQLPEEVLGSYPHELSGGMRQRVAIALALALEPRMVVFDEPTTALDVIVQQAVMSTIQDLQRENGFTALLISHDLGIVLEATDRVLVMYAGRIVEDRPSGDLMSATNHPYTEALLSCYADPRAEVVELGGIPGSPPDLSQPLEGCAFADRCPIVEPVCRTELPVLTEVGPRPGRIACHVRARGAGAGSGAHRKETTSA